jgi:general nucleoside transport system permease protein
MNNLKKTLTPAAIALALAFALASLVLVVSGHNPLTAYRAMWKNFANLDGVITSINIGARYYVSAVAIALALKMNVFNIGTNGQYQIAALFGAVVGAAIKLPAPLHVAVTLVTAMVVGAIWSSLIAILNVTRSVNPVLTGIMLNGIAASVIAYLMQSKWTNFRDPTRPEYGSTRPIPKSGQLPVFDIGKAQLQSYVVLAIILGIGFYLLVYRTRFGYDLRASGGNASAARSSGVNPKRMILITLALSGAAAGLAGMGIVLSANDQLSYGDRFPGLLGFTGIGIALLGRNHPAGVAAAALLWAALDQGARGLVTVGIPGEIAVILQGALLFIAVIVYAVWERKSLAAMIHEAATRTAAARTESVSA